METGGAASARGTLLRHQHGCWMALTWPSQDDEEFCRSDSYIKDEENECPGLEEKITAQLFILTMC